MGKQTEKELAARVSARGQLTAPCGVRTNLASQLFLPAAKHFMQMSQHIEDGQLSDRNLEDRMHGLGCVLASVSYVEGYINSFYIMASDASGIPNVAAAVCSKLANAWNHAIRDRRFSGPKILSETLRKYHKAIVHVTGKDPDWPDGLLEAAEDLIMLRNQLVHYGAYWPSERPEDLQGFIARMRTRFLPNPFYPEPENEFWPKGILGAGCARWSVETAEALVAWFKALVAECSRT